MRGIFKIGPAPLTSTSVDRLPETGYDVILAKSPQRRVNMRTRRDHAAEERKTHVDPGHVDLGADESLESR